MEALKSYDLVLLTGQILGHAVANAFLGLALLTLAYYLAGDDQGSWCGVKFGVQPILISVVCMSYFVFSAWERPYKEPWKYAFAFLAWPAYIMAFCVLILKRFNSDIEVKPVCGTEGSDAGSDTKNLAERDGHEKLVLGALIVITHYWTTMQIWWREVRLYFESPVVELMYKQRNWVIPGPVPRYIY